VISDIIGVPQRFSQGIDFVDELLEVLILRSLADASRNVRRTNAELPPSFGQVDADLTFFSRISASLDVAEYFQPFQHSGQGIRLQKELSAEFADV
jgi:hypothetical protein